MAASLMRSAASRACGRHIAQAVGRQGVASRTMATAHAAEIHFPPSVLHAPGTEMTRLDNGVRVATEARGGELASLSIAVDAGTRMESDAAAGTCAVLGKLAFAGQAKEVAAMGGHFSAEARRETTIFRATVARKDVNAALAVLAKAASAANAGAAAVAAAKGEVLCDLEGARLRPEDHLLDHLHDAAFLGSPLGRSVLGTPATVSALSADDVAAFASAFYTGPRTVVAAAGAVEHDAVVAAAAAALGARPGGGAADVDAPLADAPFVGSDKRIRFDNKPLARVALAFKGPAATSEYALPLQLAAATMGSWDRTSGIGTDVGTRWALANAENNAAYKAEVSTIAYRDTGLLVVTGTAPDVGLDNFMWFTLEALVRMCHKVTDEEVARGKTALKTQLMLATAAPAGACDDITRQVLSVGRRVHATELFARLDALSTSDVRNTVNEFVNDQDHALAAVGPIFELPDYNWIRRRSYWLRY